MIVFTVCKDLAYFDKLALKASLSLVLKRVCVCVKQGYGPPIEIQYDLVFDFTHTHTVVSVLLEVLQIGLWHEPLSH